MADLFRGLKLRGTERPKNIIERVERAMGSSDPALMDWAVNQVKRMCRKNASVVLLFSTFVPKEAFLKASFLFTVRESCAGPNSWKAIAAWFLVVN
jgi:hypothetical protein